MIDPFDMFGLLKVFAMATDGMGAEMVLAFMTGERLRPICQVPVEVLTVALRAARSFPRGRYVDVCYGVDDKTNPEEP